MNKCVAFPILLLAVATNVHASEPNQTFATSTVLGPNVRSVSGELTFPAFGNPNTVLASRDVLGNLEFIDDDGSPLGNGYASALTGIPMNAGSIDFAVTGWDDFDFIGSHSVSGYYDAYVDVFDSEGEFLETIIDARLLLPGAVHEYSYSNPDWIGGSYNVTLENSVLYGDIDYYTFTGLTPTDTIVARTLDPTGSGINTVLGWCFPTGVMWFNDDAHEGVLTSQLETAVPGSGTITLAVTGWWDYYFLGDHGVEGSYVLEIEVIPSDFHGDFNEDKVVDAADYVMWRKEFDDPDRYGLWKQYFGNTMHGSGASDAYSLPGVPEPGSLFMIVCGLGLLAIEPWRRMK